MTKQEAYNIINSAQMIIGEGAEPADRDNPDNEIYGMLSDLRDAIKTGNTK